MFKDGNIAWNKGRKIPTTSIDMRKCPYCNELRSKYGLKNHIKLAHEGYISHSHLTPFKKGHKAWNKGLTKETDERIVLYAKKTSEKLTGKPGHKHSDEFKTKQRANAIKNNLGGHTSKLRLSYKGVVLHSSYETQVAKSLDENNIKWIRPSPIKWLDKNDKEHRYYPDFYLIDYDVFLDPKNDYLILKDAEKIKRVCEQNNIRVLILDKDNLLWNKIVSKIQI